MYSCFKGFTKVYVSEGQNLQVVFDRIESNQEVILRGGVYEIDKTLVIEDKSHFSIKEMPNTVIVVKTRTSKTADGGILESGIVVNLILKSLL